MGGEKKAMWVLFKMDNMPTKEEMRKKKNSNHELHE